MLLITGAAGFIGRSLMDSLAASGERARCLLHRRVPEGGLPAGMEPAFGDLASGQGLDEALKGVDAVIHLAGTTKALTPADYYRGNARATETLVRALAGRGVRFVHVSSLAAAGPGVILDEAAPPRPMGHYGRSKLEGERIVRMFLPEAVIVRPPVVYGPRDTDVFRMLKPISEGWFVEIAGGERWFSAIYVRDLVKGLLTALRAPRASGIYFMAHRKPASWSQLCAAAAAIMGRPAPRTVRVPYPVAYAAGACAEMWARITRTAGIVSREKVAEARCKSWICDPRRASDELGFGADTGLEQGLAETLTWYKEAGWLTY